MPKNICILLVGSPLAGKTTFIKEHQAKFKKFVILSRDDLVLSVTSITDYNQAWAYAEKNRLHDEITKQFHLLLEDAVKQQKNIIIDTMNLTKSSRYPILTRLTDSYFTCGVVFSITPSEAKSRNKKRSTEENKTIPESVLDSALVRLELPQPGEVDLVYDVANFTSLLTEKNVKFPNNLLVKLQENFDQETKKKLQESVRRSKEYIKDCFSPTLISSETFTDAFLVDMEPMDKEQFMQRVETLIVEQKITYDVVWSVINNGSFSNAVNANIVRLAVRSIVVFNESNPDCKYFVSTSLIHSLIRDMPCYRYFSSGQARTVRPDLERINRYYFDDLYKEGLTNPMATQDRINQMPKVAGDKLKAIFIDLLNRHGIDTANKI